MSLLLPRITRVLPRRGLSHVHPAARAMSTLPHANVDPDGLLEYSVVYTDRTLNHMSKKFQNIMNDVRGTLTDVYGARSAIVIPGSGTFAMEAVARQLGTGRKCMVLRNGFFSYRWSHIFEMGSIPSEEVVLRAKPANSYWDIVGGTHDRARPQYAPLPVDEVMAQIAAEQPAVVFAPHVETSSGIILPDDYIAKVAAATHAHGGLFVLDCIASGCVWVDMAALGVDVLISAPQKGWSGPACAGLVMCSDKAYEAIKHETTSTSMCADLKSWLAVAEAYEGGGHMYYTTMPTESLEQFWKVQAETAEVGFDVVKDRQVELGQKVRTLLKDRGLRSVADDAYAAPSVVVSYTEDPDVKSGAKFAAQGMQIAAGVPLMLDEFSQSADYMSFRLGLFGLDKLMNVDRTVTTLADKLAQLDPK